jgi:hypothetical protein
LVGSSGYGRIIADDETWAAEEATVSGHSGTYGHGARDEHVYRFTVGRFESRGPAFSNPVAATRLIFAGGQWSQSALVDDRRLLVRALTSDAVGIEDERLAALVEAIVDDVETNALWLVLSFVSGNRLALLAVESYDANGDLVLASHRRSGRASDERSSPFHRMQAQLAQRALTSLINGVIRLIRAGFPIEVIVDHILTARSGRLDTDAQHYVLAIHTALEAWNRRYGLEYWIDDDLWEWFAERSRRPLLNQIYETVGPETKQNLASAYRHANRTTTTWRQKKLFADLQIDITSDNDRRALAVRDEILHNGYFIERWHQLDQASRQRRRDDVARLHRLALMVIFRLTAFEGAFVNPIRFETKTIKPVELPPDINSAVT